MPLFPLIRKLVALMEGYNRFYDRDSLPAEITETTWARFFNPNEPVFALVAEQEESLVGLAHYLFHRSTIQIGFNCYLQDLFTLENVRGQGIGRALIESVYEHAKQAGSSRVYWQTKENNEVARSLYDKVAEYSGL